MSAQRTEGGRRSASICRLFVSYMSVVRRCKLLITRLVKAEDVFLRTRPERRGK